MATQTGEQYFSLIPHPTSLTKKVQILFQKSAKRRLAIIDFIRGCIFLIRFDETRHTVCCLLLLFNSALQSVLLYLLYLFNVQ